MSGLGTVERMADFELGRGELGTPEMIAITERALALLSQLYVHLPSKRTLHATDPVQSLRNLRTDLDAVERGAQAMREREFHARLVRTFVDLRDRHTTYLLPQPYRSTIAFLPFLIEAVVDGRRRLHVVSKIYAPFKDEFGIAPESGDDPVVVTHWNGVPIELAVELNGDRNAGANQAARLARGLDRLTFRWLGTTLKPEEDWVVVTYKVGEGEPQETRFDWLALRRPEGAPAAPAGDSGSSFALGRDLEGEWIRTVKQKLFARPGKWDTTAESGRIAYRRHPRDADDGGYGYLRIYSFDVDPKREDHFVSSVRRILQQAPTRGLIVDIRGNPGGSISAAERLLTLLSPIPIEVEGLQFLNTEQAARLAENFYNGSGQGGAFDDRLNEARTTGSAYISSLPLAPADRAAALDQVYQGPIVLIVDALCYSASEILAAGMQDNGLATIMGTATQTGGGGANVWPYELIRDVYQDADAFPELPEEASFEVAIRRTTRVRDRAGVALEDLGAVVPAPNVAPLALADVLHDNEALLDRAVAALSSRPRYLLTAELSGERAFKLSTEGIDRVDVYVDERPLTSVSEPNGAEVALAKQGPAPSTVQFLGYADAARPGPVTSFRWSAQ
ncbi:MAG: S41 family peptidase [Thermoleophilaceae bacterium]